MNINGEPGSQEYNADQEPASETDIARMEGLASALLEPVPAQVHRRYFRVTNTGAIVMFGAFYGEQDGDIEKQHTTVALAHTGQEDHILILNYDADNTPIYVSADDQDTMAVVAKVSQELLVGAQLNTVEKAIIGEIQAFAMSISVDMPELGEELTAMNRTPGRPKPTAEAIKELVDDNTDKAVRVREYQLLTDDGRSVSIIEQSVEGSATDDVIAAGIPKLQIKYEDDDSSRAYCYIRYQNGEAALEVYDPNNPEVDMQDPHTVEDEEYEGPTENQDSPRKADVLVLTKQLQGAALSGDASTAFSNN